MTRLFHSSILSILAAPLLLLAGWGTALPAHGQLTASNAFAKAPQQIFPLLDRNTRLDMLDYFNSGSSTSSRNKLYGSSRITLLQPDRIVIEMTSASTAELMTLALGNDSVIALITTVMTPTPDSKLAIYSKDWASDLTPGLFTPPTLADWLTRDGMANRAQVEAMVPFTLASYTFNPDNGALVITNTTKEFLTPDVYAEIEGFLHPSLTYEWSKGKMKLSKP